MAKPIPEGFHTLTPHIVVKNAAKAIDFYKQAFGAKEIMRMNAGDRIGHAEIRIGNSVVMLADEWPGSNVRSPESIGGTSCTLMLYVENVDSTYKQALAAGARGVMPPADQFWGDRYGSVTDPFGHAWSMATHVRDVSEAEMKQAMDAMVSQQKTKQAQHG
jgi:PhnB protein